MRSRNYRKCVAVGVQLSLSLSSLCVPISVYHSLQRRTDKVKNLNWAHFTSQADSYKSFNLQTEYCAHFEQIKKREEIFDERRQPNAANEIQHFVHNFALRKRWNFYWSLTFELKRPINTWADFFFFTFWKMYLCKCIAIRMSSASSQVSQKIMTTRRQERERFIERIMKFFVFWFCTVATVNSIYSMACCVRTLKAIDRCTSRAMATTMAAIAPTTTAQGFHIELLFVNDKMVAARLRAATIHWFDRSMARHLPLLSTPMTKSFRSFNIIEFIAVEKSAAAETKSQMYWPFVAGERTHAVQRFSSFVIFIRNLDESFRCLFFRWHTLYTRQQHIKRSTYLRSTRLTQR